MRPPGRSAWRMLRRPATGLAKNIVPKRAKTKSYWLVGRAYSASPRTKLRLVTPRDFISARAWSRKASQQSIPTTRPVAPTWPARRIAVSPKPHPTSRTWSPERTGRVGNTASLWRDRPPTRMCLKRMNLGASTSFQNRTNSLSSAYAVAPALGGALKGAGLFMGPASLVRRLWFKGARGKPPASRLLGGRMREIWRFRGERPSLSRMRQRFRHFGTARE